MKIITRMLILVAVVATLFSATGCNKLQARDQLNKGVAAYKGTHYEQAIDHFRKAVDLDPSLLNARLYLATALANQYVPGVPDPDNEKIAQQAIDEFQKVLEMKPVVEQQVGSLKGIASLYFNMKQLDKAKEYHRKVAALDPNDPETYYSIGVIDWTESYQPRMEERGKLGLKPEAPLNDKAVCSALKSKNWNIILDGMENLKKALDLRPDYDDAMAYVNLMYREKADVECDDPAQRAADLKTADEWVDKTMAQKKANAEKKQAATGGGVTMDNTQ